MKWYVYYSAGSCNYGDHATGLDVYNTLEEALVAVAELKQWLAYDGGGEVVVLIAGNEVPVVASKAGM